MQHRLTALYHPARGLAAAALLVAALAGCHRKHLDVTMDTIAAPKAKPEVDTIDLKSYHPNEAGSVMIVMYHRFEAKEPNGDLNRTPDTFRQDLETLYSKGYRPVTLTDFIDNHMDVPAGKTPIVLTFDDSLPSQFKTVTGADGQMHIDPDCAVGIMETFHKTHPDWATKGTFFVLPQTEKSPPPFYDPNTVADKFAYLDSHGYEVQNHTTTHPQLNRLSGDRVEWEIGNAYHSIRQLDPKTSMDIVALPYGRLPQKQYRHFLLSGSADGMTYHNKAVILAAYRPEASPANKVGVKITDQIHYWDPESVERIKPNPAQANLPGTLEYWIKYFDANPEQRYISGGNPKVCCVPASLKSRVDAEAVRRQGKVLQLYSLTGGAGGGGLSVEGGSSATAPSAVATKPASGLDLSVDTKTR